MSAHLWQSLLSTKGDREFVTYAGSVAQRHLWDDLRSAGEAAAAGLRARGVQRGTPVAMVLTNGFAACATVLGVWLCGGVVVSLPLRGRGQRPDEYAELLGAMVAQTAAHLVVVEQAHAEDVATGQLASCGIDVIACEGLPRESPIEPELPDDDDVVFVQYSSGTTAEPRGCQLTAAAIDAQLAGLAEALSLDPAADRGAMWLPLSHDMGFFGGLLLFWSLGVPGLLSSPGRFLVSPRAWLDECAEFGATLTVAPNFALDLAARAVARRGPSSQLSLRACIVGGEEVQATTLQRAADALGPYGFRPEALTPAYGLAEATLAVTIADVHSAPSTIDLDAEALADGAVARPDDRAARTASLVSVGRALRGVTVSIVGDKEVGEVVVESPSLAAGYVGQPEAAGERFRDGELRTGDLGFLSDGELYVVGRDDDVLVVAGRNVDARRVEQALCAHPDLRHGNAVLVDRHKDGRPSLIAYVECRNTDRDAERLVRELAAAARAVLPLPIDEWVLLKRGRIPKTASGKTRRFRLRQSPPTEADVAARVVTA